MWLPEIHMTVTLARIVFSLVAISCILNCSFALASPVSSKDASTIKNSKTVKVWKVNQHNAWGSYITYASPQFFRIDSSSGGSLIAKAPDWKLHFFHTQDRRICAFTYYYWMQRKHDLGSVEDSGQQPEDCKVSGIPGKMYSFDVNFTDSGQAGSGLLFRSDTKKNQFKRAHIVVAAGLKTKFPPQLKSIWCTLFEVPVRCKIPLEIKYDLRFGGHIYHFQTDREAMVSVPIDFFKPPSGFKEGGTPLVVFFGTQFEDAWSTLLMDTK